MKILLPLLFLLSFGLSVFAADTEKDATADATADAEIEKVSQMDALKAHFPDGLTDADGKEVKLESLEGKVVGIYFSAAWCGPCRAFSPVLFKYRDKYADDFQVVFVSSDKSDEAQSVYMKKNKMNCPTMKRRGPAANALSQKYGVRGIPALVLLDQNGNFFTRDGRDVVMNDLDMTQVTAGKTKIVVEEYLCGKCDKIHTRNKIVASDPAEAAKLK